MKLQVEVPLETQDDESSGKDTSSGKGDASDQLCVRERRGSVRQEGREGTEDAGPADGEVQEEQKAGGEEGSVKMEPPDGGWGWVVAFASLLIMTLIPVMSYCFGVLFSRYLLLSGTSSTTTAWIFNTQNFLFNTIGLFVRPLSQEFGWRKVAITGTFLASLGFGITAFAPSPEFFFFSFSILGGVGGGIITPLCYVVVPSYFTRRRGVANAIMGFGSGLGQIAVPPFLRVLQETFADRGATLIFSGLMFHSCLAATTFHPVERHMKPSRAKATTESDQDTKPPPKPQTTTSTSSPKPSIFVRVAKSTMSDLSILRSRRAAIITVAWALAISSTLNFLMMVPFALQDAGFSLDFSAWCLSSLGVSSLVVRTLASALTDLPFFKVTVFFVAGLVIMATSTAVFPLVGSQGWLLAVSLGYGAGLGTIAGLNTLVMIDVMGIDRLAPLFGTTSLISAITVLSLGTVIGIIRDASGSYPISLWFAAGMLGCSVLLWALMGRATRWDKERMEEGRPNL